MRVLCEGTTRVYYVSVLCECSPGVSVSGCSTTTSLGGAKRDAADRKEPCFLLAASVRGLANPHLLLIWESS